MYTIYSTCNQSWLKTGKIEEAVVLVSIHLVENALSEGELERGQEVESAEETFS